MSSSPPKATPDAKAEAKARIKDAGREGRLSFRNFAEHQMRREFKDMALDKCSEHVRRFALCAEEQGLMVVFNCRHHSKALNECMAVHNSPEAFEKYMVEHKEELEKRTLKT